jgi:trehalose 6-phosphate synthase
MYPSPGSARSAIAVAPVVTATARASLLVMSNRMPSLTSGREREVGGLVSALEPALRDENAVWLGWSGQERSHGSRIMIDASEQPVRARFDLTRSTRQRFYAGFCNSVLWPLFHGFPERIRSSDGDWSAYARANDRYARHAVELVQRDAAIWVHDYHLLLAARALRARGHRGRIGLFLHIPFPERELLEAIPWSADLVEAMLDFDLLGFQTRRSATSFLSAASRVKSATCAATTVRRGTRVTEIDVFPATICPRVFREAAPELPEVSRLRAILGGRRLILGVDRLDYSKGIPERLDAYEQMLERFPQWRGRITFLQISVPSRADLPDYVDLRRRVEAQVGHINGRFGDIDWVPVRYLYRAYDHHLLAQLYRLADVALVTPLCDGMNLVAKEFVASQDPDRPGVLVLSQHAGAAETLTSAILTDPSAPAELAADIHRALDMPASERIGRQRELAAALDREGDARDWAQRFLARLGHGNLGVD